MRKINSLLLHYIITYIIQHKLKNLYSDRNVTPSPWDFRLIRYIPRASAPGDSLPRPPPPPLPLPPSPSPSPSPFCRREKRETQSPFSISQRFLPFSSDFNGSFRLGICLPSSFLNPCIKLILISPEHNNFGVYEGFLLVSRFCFCWDWECGERLGMEEEAIPERGAADGDRASSSSSSPTSAASENPLEEAAVAEGAAESSPMDTPRNGPGDCARAPMSPLASIRQQAKHVRSGSFQKWRRQMQRAWRWGPGGRGGAAGGGGGREQGMRATLNLEVMANQKRQWYRIHSRARVLLVPPF